MNLLANFNQILEKVRGLKVIIFLKLCRKWELSGIERFKLELSETEANDSGIISSAQQQPVVP